MIDFKSYTDKDFILELGGGTSEIQQPILKELRRYINLDKINGEDFDDADWGLLIEDSMVDLIYASHILEHIHKLQHLLNECWRVLKPEGKLYAIVPHRSNPGAYAIDHVRFFDEFTFTSLTVPDNVRGEWKPWIIENMVTNERGDIHVVMHPRK